MNREFTEQLLTLVLTELEDRGVDTDIIGCKSFDEIVDELLNIEDAAVQEEK